MPPVSSPAIETQRPARKAAPAGRKYLYAVVAAGSTLREDSLGVGEAAVFALTEEPLAALVSEFPQPRLRPERRHIAAHQAVLQQLLASTTPLPVSFGTLADSPEALCRILRRNRRAFLEQLHRVEGRVEMGLRVRWDVPNLFEYFVHTHPELEQARDRYFGGAREPSRDERIELGRVFDQLLQQDRESYAEKIERILASCCSEMQRDRCRSEQEVMQLACLVGREALPEFEACVCRAAELFDCHFSFDYSGPWPPYSFVELHLDL